MSAISFIACGIFALYFVGYYTIVLRGHFYFDMSGHPGEGSRDGVDWMIAS